MLVAGLMAGMVSFVAHGLVDNAFFLVDLAFVFMMMLALVQLPFLAASGPRNAPSKDLRAAAKCLPGGEDLCVS
jgi:hypothetical protein